MDQKNKQKTQAQKASTTIRLTHKHNGFGKLPQRTYNKTEWIKRTNERNFLSNQPNTTKRNEAKTNKTNEMQETIKATQH